MGSYITTKEAAYYLTNRGYKINPASLTVARSQGRGPSYLRIGRSVRYQVSDLDAFLSKKTKRIHLES